MPVTLVSFGQVPKVTIRLVVSAANVHEAKNEVWLADLTGSLMREGTTTLSSDAVARELANMGGELNIAVGPDTTSIMADVSGRSRGDAVKLIADVAQQPRLPESELGRLKSDLLRNLSIQRSTPQAVAQEKFAELIYGDHPYGRIFPKEAELKAFSIDQVAASTRSTTWRVVPGCTSLAFSTLPRWRPPSGRLSASGKGGIGRRRQGAATGSTRFALLDRPSAPQSTLWLGLRVPSPSHKDWVPLQVTDALLGGAFGSRITSNIREQKGYTYSPGSTVSSHPGHASWVETADVTTNVTGESLKEIFFEIQRLRKEPPPAAELRGIQNNLAGIFVVQNASRGGVIGRLVFVDQHGLGDQYLSTYVKQVMAVTPEEVRRIANDYLTPDTMTLVVVGDVKTVKEQVAPWAAR